MPNDFAIFPICPSVRLLRTLANFVASLNLSIAPNNPLAVLRSLFNGCVGFIIGAVINSVSPIIPFLGTCKIWAPLSNFISKFKI